MEERDRIRYETLFYCQKLEDGFLSGDNARALFIRSKLPLLDLTRIWKLSDITRDNKLDVFEFSLAMHFIELKLMGGEIPKLNDILVPDSYKEVMLPIITVQEKQQIDEVFEYTDTNLQRFLDKDIVKPMFLSSGLSSSVLSKIWNIADLDRDGKFCLFEFTIAMHLLKNCMKGLNLNGPVNPFGCLPDEDNAIRLYKEKLAVFDKKFLVKQKNNEDDVFQNCTDSAESPVLELLASYLLDGQHVSQQDKRDPGIMNENQDVFVGENDKSFYDNHQHHVLASLRGSDSLVAQESPEDSTEIKRHEIIDNALDIDLENVFETVAKETGGESEEAPKFIAQPPVGYTETEEDEEEIPVLPYFKRRTYFGKDLIFEDPIGSELIGDVEFEVDFDYIINDIEKEMVDEERRLPIARVLPIYKIPPVVDEKPYEKSMTSKERREIDLHFIDVKTGSFSEKENHSFNNRKNELVVGMMKNESDREVITNKQSTSYKDYIQTNIREGNTKNLNSVSGTVDDIVEQKKLLLQSQKEERKKHRESLNNKRNDQNSAFSTGFPVMKGTEQINVNKNAHRSTFEKENLTSSNTGQNNNNAKVTNTTFKGNITSTVHSIEPISNNENQSEENDRKDLETSEKERILLERIEFLERKRQKFYEKKQRDFMSNNARQENEVHANLKGKENIQDDRGHNQVNKNMHKKFTTENKKQDSESYSSADSWICRPKEHRKDNEDEKRRLAEVLAAKRKTEAELERQRQEVLRAAEKRRLEEEAKQREEEKEAEERKRHFLENLQRLKQRVLTEEEEKSKGSKVSPVINRKVHSTGKLGSGFDSFNKSQSLSGNTNVGNTSAKSGTSDPIQNKVLTETKSPQNDGNGEGIRHQEKADDVKSDNQNSSNEEELRKADEMRRENFNSNRKLFMKKIQMGAEHNAQVIKREKNPKVRPKSYYGGMFNKPVHQIIDDSILAQNVDSTSVGDLVDEEALKQFQRERELKKEQEKVNKLRSSLERESSYTVENVEKLFCDADTETKKQVDNEWDNLERKETKSSSHPHRRSLVNTLTTEWNSFIDVLEEDKRRESDTIKMRQEISSQRKSSLSRTPVSKPTSVTTPVDVVKSDISKEILEEREIFAKQSGKVKKMVTSYKRLSVPCFLSQDGAWNFEKSEEDPKMLENKLQAELYRQEPDDKRFDQKTVIKENAPKRKTGLAQAWTHMISNPPKTDE